MAAAAAAVVAVVAVDPKRRPASKRGEEQRAGPSNYIQYVRTGRDIIKADGQSRLPFNTCLTILTSLPTRIF